MGWDGMPYISLSILHCIRVKSMYLSFLTQVIERKEMLPKQLFTRIATGGDSFDRLTVLTNRLDRLFGSVERSTYD